LSFKKKRNRNKEVGRRREEAERRIRRRERNLFVKNELKKNSYTLYILPIPKPVHP
jgi:hypothetical protein